MNRWSEVIDKQREMKENYAAKLSSLVTQPFEVHS